MNFKATPSQFNSKQINKKVENPFWARLKNAKTLSEVGSISSISFMECEPYNFAVTNSNRIDIFSSRDCQKLKTIVKFNETAYSGSLKADGKLIVAGDHSGLVSLFDSQTKSRLRSFQGHEGPVCGCCFSPHVGGDQVVVSVSDDRSLRIWDIGTGQARRVYSNTSLDHIRAVKIPSFCPDLCLTGSYDGFGRIYDPRTPSNSPILSVETKWPIYSLCWLSESSRQFVTAGTGGIYIWDSLNSSNYIARLDGHHKAVTCLASTHEWLLSGSLDRHVKVWNSISFECEHVFSYSDPVLSLGYARGVLACGMVGGSLSVKSCSLNSISATKTTSSLSLKSYDRMLKEFRHSSALDEALQSRASPEETVALIRQLIVRNRLAASINGRTENKLTPLVSFIIKNFYDQRFTSTLVTVIEQLLDGYSFDSFSPKFRSRLVTLRRMVSSEIACIEAMMIAQGSFTALCLLNDF